MSAPNSKGIGDISRLLKSAFQQPIRTNQKIATGSTINSVEIRYQETVEGLTWEVYIGGGYKWILLGKRANTKLPVEKVGGKFRLVKPLRDWKRAVGFGGSDFLLARAIARKARPKVDLIKQSETILLNSNLDQLIFNLGFGETFLKKLTNEFQPER